MARQSNDKLPDLPKTLAEFDLRADSEASEFYENIEKLLKKHQPGTWGPYAFGCLRNAWQNPQRLSYAPPHHVLNSIEANCTYARGQNQESVDNRTFFRVMGVYVNRTDLWHCWLASKHLSHFALAMHREQLELQYHPSARVIARFIELFSAPSIPALSARFFDKYGLTTDDWLRLCVAIFSHAINTPNGCIWRQVTESFAASVLKISQTGLSSFFQLSSASPKQIGNRYRTLREQTKPRFHSLIRSAFLETPIIAFDDGRLLLPHPDLLFRHGGEGLSRVIKDLPDFQNSETGCQKEFGESVERYVGKVLSCITKRMRILRSDELADFATGESCDLLLEAEDCIFLVESKSTTLRANILTEEVIVKDGSNKHVTKGLVQLSQTSKDIREGAYNSLGIDKAKPIVGMVVTLGEIPFANSDWYFDTFFRKRTEEKIGPNVDANFGLSEKPGVVSLAAFEMVVTAIEHFKLSPIELFKEKKEQANPTLGDWEFYVRSRLSAAGVVNDPLPFVTEQLNKFAESVGAPAHGQLTALFRAFGIEVQVSKES